MSVETGFPVIQRLCGYLAQLLFSFQQGLYHHRFPNFENSDPKMRGLSPSELIEMYGWPTPERLTSDLWRWLERKPKLANPKDPCPIAIVEYLTNAKLLSAEDDGNYSNAEPVIRKQDWLKTVEQAGILSELSDRTDERLARLAAKYVFSQGESPGKMSGETATTDSNPLPAVRGDWSHLLDSLTEGKSDFIDALFARLSSGRGPGDAHILLAFLIKVLGTRLVLTTNFDPFLDLALQREGMQPTVFDVFRDAIVPHPILVGERLSIVKLHGSVYGLRVGERLQVALDESTRSRILSYIPERALVVVLGFSGWERRTVQLLEAWAGKHNRQGPDGDKPHVLWLHAESRSFPCERLIKRLTAASGERGARRDECPVHSRRILDAGTFLASTYFRFTTAFPVSNIGYSSLAPVRVPAPEGKSPLERICVFCQNPDDLVVMKAMETWKKYSVPYRSKQYRGNLRFGTSTSLAMASLAAMLRGEHYAVIWIDLEPHHTVEGVVAELLDKMRVYDPELPLLHLPRPPADSSASSDSEHTGREPELEKARERIWDGLLRRPYALCFDQVEAFSRPHTVHHGTPHQTVGAGTDITQISRLIRFLKSLMSVIEDRNAPSDVYFALAIDVPRERHAAGAEGEEPGKLWSQTFHEVSTFFTSLRLAEKKVPSQNEYGRAVEIFDESDRQRRWPSDSTFRKILGIAEEGTAGFPAILHFTTLLGTATSKTIDRPGENSLLPSLLATLAIFRRPRSIVSVRSVIATHLGKSCRWPEEHSIDLRKSFEWLDRGLDRLDAEGGICRFEGETIWVFGVVHETVYKILTESVQESKLVELLRQSGRTNPTQVRVLVGTFLNLVTLGFWHRRIARHYYSGVFLPSNDLQAFWEYVYHRVAAIRYLTSAQALAHRFAAMDEPVWRDELLEALQSLPCADEASPIGPRGELLAVRTKKESPQLDELMALRGKKDGEAIRHLIQLLKYLGQADDPYIRRLNAMYGERSKLQEFSSWDLVAALLYVNRAVHLEALRRTFDREREKLLAALPAETIYGWCSQLVETDLKAMSGQRLGDGLTEDLRERLEKGPRTVVTSSRLNRGGLVGLSIQRMREQLNEFAGVVTYLRRDYDTALVKIWEPIAPPEDALSRLVVQKLRIGLDSSGSQSFNLGAIVQSARIRFASEPAAAARDCDELWESLVQAGSLNLPREGGSTSRKKGASGRSGDQGRISVTEYARRFCRYGEALRRTAGCLGQLGEGVAAESAAKLATRLTKHVLEQVIQFGRLEESREAERLLGQQELSNLRRAIDLQLVRLPPWSCFDRLPHNMPLKAKGSRPEIAAAATFARQLEETARESPGASSSDYYEYRFDALALQARTQGILGHYVDAHRQLDRAAAGLERVRIRHHVSLAMVHIYRAEICAFSAHDALQNREAAQSDRHEASSLKEKAGHAQALLVRAVEDLESAERHLHGGRRDLTSWIYLYLGRAQICVERLLLEISCYDAEDLWPADWNYARFSAHVERLLETGLSALRSALDMIPFRTACTFEASDQPQHYPERKAIGLWLQLMLAGDAALILGRVKRYFDPTSRRPGKQRPRDRRAILSEDVSRGNRFDGALRLETYLEMWCEWVQSYRFDRFAHALNGKKQDRALIRDWKRIRERFSGPHQDDGLCLRSALLEESRDFLSNHLRTFWDLRRASREIEEVESDSSGDAVEPPT
jgi:hypothetical protein